jgi:hypothetical protein
MEYFKIIDKEIIYKWKKNYINYNNLFESLSKIQKLCIIHIKLIN